MKSFIYFWYRFLWRYAGSLPLRKLPVHLDLELTSRCNLSCIMCPHSEKENGFPKGDMKEEVAKSIILQGKGYVKSIKFNWRGEPTLYKKLPEIISCAKQNGYVETMINTNLHCSKNALKDIVEAGIDKIIISVDSFNADTYSQIRGGGNLDIVLENLDFLKNLKKMKGVKRNFDIIIQARRQKLNENEKFPDDVLVKDATRRTKNGNYYLEDQKYKERQNCLMPWRRLLISFQGNVFPCCADWFEKNKIGEIKNGNNLHFLWKGKEIEDLRRNLITKKAFLYEPCKSCISRESYK